MDSSQSNPKITKNDETKIKKYITFLHSKPINCICYIQ